VSFWTVDDVIVDACLQTFPAQQVGPTVADLVSALDAQVGTDMASLGNPTVGGHPSSRVVMRASAAGKTCMTDKLGIWQDLDIAGQIRTIDLTPGPAGQEDNVWIVDVDGTRVVIVGYFDESDAEQSGSLIELIDSIEFLQR
jgi:hypothetical protein